MTTAIAKHAKHFESASKEAHAARLGMWVFLGSEVLLFSGLLALYAAYRAHDPQAFRQGVEHATKWLGSLNTAILLTSSVLAALAVDAARQAKNGRSALYLIGTIALGIAFLTIKASEYLQHFREGIYPGGTGKFFVEHANPGLAPFWTLYFVSTGLHAIHVGVGLLVLGTVTWNLLRRRIAPERIYPLENATLFWHLIDVIWIFLWPLYYLV